MSSLFSQAWVHVPAGFSQRGLRIGYNIRDCWRSWNPIHPSIQLLIHPSFFLPPLPPPFLPSFFLSFPPFLPPIHLPIYLTAQPPTHPFISLFSCKSIHLSIHQSTHPSLLSFIHFPIYPPTINSSLSPSSCLSAHSLPSPSCHPIFIELLPCVRHYVHFIDKESDNSRWEMICLRSG